MSAPPFQGLLQWPIAAALALLPASQTLGTTWTSVDYPGNVDEQLTAAPGAKALGRYYDPLKNESGAFLYEGSSFTPLGLAHPDAKTTIAWGMESDQIVGWWLPNSEGESTKGFLLKDGTYQDVAPPDSVSSQALDISGQTIVGNYFDSQGSEYGFVYDGVSYTTISRPDFRLVSANSISGGKVVGTYTNHPSFPLGFLYENGTLSPLDYPGSWTTRPLGISGDLIVGQYQTVPDGPLASFLYDGVAWMRLEFPRSQGTQVWGIDGKRIVGTYLDESGVHGFIADLAAPSFWFLDANGDGSANLTDFGILKAHFGLPGEHFQGDFDGTGRIDLNDFGLFKANIEGGAGAAIPEPSTWLLATLAAVGCTVIRRRRS